ncbi:MAG: hypothetical protein Q7S27_05810 [Nanoarchaeota archaeon]|nr:hypothetical protein [Nanoarchaeota archaeon]
MREIELQPEQILVPGEYKLGNESILKIYYRIFDRDHGRDLPPVITARADFISESQRQERFERKIEMLNRQIKEFRAVDAGYFLPLVKKDFETFSVLIKKSPYYLLDGNHRSAAATLTHNPIRALEIENDDDISKIEEMVEKGGVFDFKFKEKDLYTLLSSFEDYCLGEEHAIGRGKIDKVKSVRERVDALVSNGDLPQYIIDKYKAK